MDTLKMDTHPLKMDIHPLKMDTLQTHACRKGRVIVLFAFLIAIAGSAGAEEAKREEDPFGGRLFAPEIIMQNQSRLGLTKRQNEAMVKLMQGFQSGIVDKQWRLTQARQTLLTLLDARPADEAEIEATLKDLLAVENSVKQAHILLLVRLRNLLTEEQITLLGATR